MLHAHAARAVAQPSRGSSFLTQEFALVTLANFALFVSMQSLVPTLPLYIQRLGGSEAAIGGVGGAFVLAAVAVRPWVGSLLDERGRKGVLIGSLTLFAAAGLLYPLAGSILALLAVRLLQGLGWGGAVPAAGTIVADVVPAERRGEGMGYFSLSPNLATALAPAAGLALVGTLGFAPLFVAAAACAVAAAVLVLPLHESTPVLRSEQHSRKLKAPGVVFERAALVPYVVAGMLAFTMGGLTTFVVIDAAQRPVGDPKLFFLLYAGVLLVTRPVAGWVSDRYGRGSVLAPGVALAAAGLVVLAATAGPWTLPTAAVLYGLGFGGTQPALQALVVDRASMTRRGTAVSAYYIAFDLGVGLGTVLFGISAAVVGLPTTFLLAGGVVLSALLVLKTGRR